MPILVKDRDMPDACGSCPCFHAENPMYCQAVKAAVQKPRIVRPYAKGLPEWCPLIEIPKHGRLIDADALIKRIPTNFISIYCVERILEKINTAPTIIPAEEGERC